MGSVIVEDRFHCSVTCGNFLDQGSTLYPLHDRQIFIHYATKEVPFCVFYGGYCVFNQCIYNKN